MKKSLILLAACSAALVSCGKMGEDGLYSRASGEEVVFSLSNQPSSPNTKSTYSGETVEGIERIDWVEGEQLTIACEQTMTPFFNYTVTSVETDGHNSRAKVSHGPGETGLRWNKDGVYYFYAVSPALSTLIPEGYAVFTLPVSQSQDSLRSGWDESHTNFKSAVSPAYMQMTSKTKVTKSGEGPGDPVDLPFVMLPTALEFTLTGEADMVIDEVRLESSSTSLTGEYQVNMKVEESEERPDYPKIVIQDPRFVYNSASISLSDGGRSNVTVKAATDTSEGESVTLTFMLLPQDVQDLTLFLTREDESGNPYTVKTRLSYADGTTLKFDAHKKYRITGMMVKEDLALYINETLISLLPWERVEKHEVIIR